MYVLTNALRKGDLFHHFTAVYQARKIHHNGLIKMSQAVGDIVRFLLSGHKPLYTNFSGFDTKNALPHFATKSYRKIPIGNL